MSGIKDAKRRQQRRRRKKKIQRLTVIFGSLFLILLLVFAVRGISHKINEKEKKAEKKTTVKKEKIDTSHVKVKNLVINTKDSKKDKNKTRTITISSMGDCTLGTDENFDYDTSLNAYYESYGSEYFFRNVKDIFSADDLTIANFEGTLTDSEEREEKQFAFKAPAEFSSILSDGAVEAVTLANNHSHDYGEQGFADTLAALDQEGITHFGYDETAVIEVKGIKVGLVGIYELKDHLDRTEQLKQNIAKVKEQGAVITIVIFHWGNEKEEIPDSNQTTLGRLAIDEGADLVCGHHPHVLQGIETYKGKNIVYSLGNFCFGGNSYPSDMDSMIFQQTFTVDKSGVSTDNNTNIIPCSISSDYDYNNYQPTPAEGEEADRIMDKIEERSSWITPASIEETVSSAKEETSGSNESDEDTSDKS